jgi:hypothetical protein
MTKQVRKLRKARNWKEVREAFLTDGAAAIQFNRYVDAALSYSFKLRATNNNRGLWSIQTAKKDQRSRRSIKRRGAGTQWLNVGWTIGSKSGISKNAEYAFYQMLGNGITALDEKMKNQAPDLFCWIMRQINTNNEIPAGILVLINVSAKGCR